jgi:acyl carrier protein
MSSRWRRFEVMLPLQFNDGRVVPPDWIAEAALEIVDQFGAASYETQKVEGHLPDRYRVMNHTWLRSVSFRVLTLLAIAAATGCDRGSPPDSGQAAGVKSPDRGPTPNPGPAAAVKSSDRGSASDEPAIIAILAEQFGKKPEEIKSSTSLKDLGADELDLVEVVMELEEEFHVGIEDGAIAKAAGVEGADKMLAALTPTKLAALVAEARRGKSDGGTKARR